MVGPGRGELTDRFRELYDRTYDRVWGFVLRRLPNEDEARDVVGDTYMAVWRRMRDVPSDEMRADAWVFGTARRVIANHRRAHSRRQRLVDRLGQVRHTEIELGEGNERLQRALAGLPSRHRELLELAMWDDLTVAQIAQILDISENAVSIRLHRARAALRERYDAIAEKEESL